MWKLANCLHSFCRVSSKTLRKLCLFTKFLHKESRWNYGIYVVWACGHLQKESYHVTCLLIGVKIAAGNYMSKVNNRSTRVRCEICSKLTIKFWRLYCYLWTYFTLCSSVSAANFEQVNAGWDIFIWNAARILFPIFSTFYALIRRPFEWKMKKTLKITSCTVLFLFFQTSLTCSTQNLSFAFSNRTFYHLLAQNRNLINNQWMNNSLMNNLLLFVSYRVLFGA